MWAFSSPLNIGVRRINWINRGVLNTISLKNVITNFLSLGASMSVTRSSKYSLPPLNRKSGRTGRTKRGEGGRCWFSKSGQDSGDWNVSERDSRLVNVERAATIA